VSTPPVALTIAGSDSGGGAGVQADLRTFGALGVFGTSAITAVTAQNTVEVRAVHPVPAEIVVAQVACVLDDLDVAAVKTGMLGDAGVVDAVAALADAGRLPNLVVDPVLVASSGARLAEAGAERRYLERLVPLARVVTPNLREAEVLLGERIDTLDAQREAAVALHRLGPEVAVVTGGHAVADDGGDAVDVVATAAGVRELRAPRVATVNTHGTGCTFASAITAGLARGADVGEAVGLAKDFVHRAVVRAAGWRLGRGHGPLDHLGWEDTAP
jgi:hydroxymethylpyrimidine/phosphomethylpyrimidine kinase